jgi:hypothetical protein
MGDPRSFPADEAAFGEFLRAHDATPLPNPPIELPNGLTDTRN